MDLREMLEEEGHEVVGEARDGAEAVALACDLAPDAVFMDVKMPGTDGLDAARAIGERCPAAVVMVTAFSQAEVVRSAAEAGAMAYVVKPFEKKDVIPALHVAVSRFAEARELEEQVSDLAERLETRKALDRAKGVLMERGLSEPEAFRRLRRLAMDKRLTLRQVAEAVLLASEAEEG
ncbi:MAG: response regulator [Coriobacteriia bacterium]|nr:response regulator [Coriobacteriia bacterium]